MEVVDGEPKVKWAPKVNRWMGAEIQAVLKGAERLNGEWKPTEGATAAEKDGGVRGGIFHVQPKYAKNLMCRGK